MEHQSTLIENIAHQTGLSSDTVHVIWSMMEPLVNRKLTVGSCIEMVQIKTGRGTAFLDSLNLIDEVKSDVINLSTTLKADLVRAIYSTMSRKSGK